MIPSDEIWNSYERGRDRGGEIFVRVMSLFALVMGTLSGAIEGFRDHVRRVRSEES